MSSEILTGRHGEVLAHFLRADFAIVNKGVY